MIQKKPIYMMNVTWTVTIEGMTMWQVCAAVNIMGYLM